MPGTILGLNGMPERHTYVEDYPCLFPNRLIHSRHITAASNKVQGYASLKKICRSAIMDERSINEIKKDFEAKLKIRGSLDWLVSKVTSLECAFGNPNVSSRDAKMTSVRSCMAKQLS